MGVELPGLAGPLACPLSLPPTHPTPPHPTPPNHPRHPQTDLKIVDTAADPLVYVHGDDLAFDGSGEPLTVVNRNAMYGYGLGVMYKAPDEIQDAWCVCPGCSVACGGCWAAAQPAVPGALAMSGRGACAGAASHG